MAHRPTQLEVAWRWGRRNPVISALSLLIFVLLVALTVGSLVAADRWRAKSEEAIRAEREADTGWAAIERATPTGTPQPLSSTVPQRAEGGVDPGGQGTDRG